MAPRQLTVEYTLWEATHQVGQVRMAWATATGGQIGDLVPAWRCCRCGGVEVCELWLTQTHGCEPAPDGGCRSGCARVRGSRPAGPWSGTPYWLPPTGWAA